MAIFGNHFKLNEYSNIRSLEATNTEYSFDPCFALPKVLYALRTALCFQSSLLQKFDTLLRSHLVENANIDIANNDLTWTQASLPVSAGGLGVGITTQLACSAILASSAGCAETVSQMLPSWLREAPYQTHNDALIAWRSAGHMQGTTTYLPSFSSPESLGSSQGESHIRVPTEHSIRHLLTSSSISRFQKEIRSVAK